MASLAISSEETPPKPPSPLSKPVRREEWTRLANWLLVWVVVANAGFVLMWFIGAPPRNLEIIVTGVIGLIVRNQPRWVQFTAFAAAMAYSLLGFVAGLFNLSIVSLLHSLQFFMELNPAQSIEYMVGAGAIAFLAGIAFVCLKRQQGFADLRMLLLAILVVMSFAQFDKWMGRGMRGHYERTAVEGTPFTSAVSQTGFGTAAGAAPRNLVVVMVESMGLPLGNAEMQRLMFARYRQPDVASRFELKTGSSVYYNSTTAGEIRELCGRWDDYYDLREVRDDGCLPARLRHAGFETSAYHSFTGEFFDRTLWYPNIGFQNRTFAGELLSEGLPECGGVFPGVCDREIPRVLAAKLKSAERPQFIYWLTVNSHLPVPPGENLNVENCKRVSPKLAEEYPMICRQFAIWHDMDEALVREITAPDFPPTDILIVGDHMPPYFDRHHRSQFAPDRVPWLLLRWKGGEAAPQPAVAAQSATPSARG